MLLSKARYSYIKQSEGKLLSAYEKYWLHDICIDNFLNTVYFNVFRVVAFCNSKVILYISSVFIFWG